MKKEDFIKSFKNVLLTLSYDYKLDDEFKEKQQELGANICTSNEDILTLVRHPRLND